MTRRPLIGVVVALILLTACSGQHVVERGDYTIYVQPKSLLPRGGMGAQVLGTLAVREGCVVLEWPDEGLWYPVIWPAGTTIASTDPFAIELPSGEELGIGDSVLGGGGYLYPSHVDIDIPAECLPETNEIAVFNPDDNPTKR